MFFETADAGRCSVPAVFGSVVVPVEASLAYSGVVFCNGGFVPAVAKSSARWPVLGSGFLFFGQL